MKLNSKIDALTLMLTDLRTRNEPIRHKAAFKGSFLVRRSVSIRLNASILEFNFILFLILHELDNLHSFLKRYFFIVY